MRLCLNMIVKDEAARITRALDSAAPFVTAAVIVDTGSTDDTKKVLTDYFTHHKIDFQITDAPFINWAQARNAALNAARYARRKFDFDYILLMDADMELRVNDAVEFHKPKDGLSYDMYQHAGSLHYLNRRLMRWDAPANYVGVTHEYLDAPAAGAIPESVAFFYDYADGANRPNKYLRDIRLLKEGLRAEPKNDRYMFYLAQSYRDAGKPLEAIKWYRRRIEAGGWDEEIFMSQMAIAHCYKGMGDEASFVHEMLLAYDMRPSRAEAAYDLATYYRHKGKNAAASLFAEEVLRTPRTEDGLFVNDYVYEVGGQEELSIAGFYVPDRKERGLQVTNELCLKDTVYRGARDHARTNLYYYLPKLEEYCPSFEWQPVRWTPPAEWNALNPSITEHYGRMWMNIRTVNYKIDEHGRYCRFLDGEWKYHDDWVTYPIRTRNFLVVVDDDLSIVDPVELLPPGNMPEPLFKPVLGFEDVRIYSWKDPAHILPELWTSATVREMAADGYCEQVRARVRLDPGAELVDWQKMLRTPRLYEKNWAPLVDGDTLRFVYRLGEMVDQDGRTTHRCPTGLATDHISGGSQYIRFGDGWLGLVHEARPMPGREGVRYYIHRFVFLEDDFRVSKISYPFVFNDKCIEFAAGLCRHPTEDKLVISYGFRDNEARIATVAVNDVSIFLWHHSK